MKILSLFAHPHGILNLNVSYVECERRYLGLTIPVKLRCVISAFLMATNNFLCVTLATDK